MEHIKSTIQSLVNSAAMDLYNMIPAEAHTQSICIKCKEDWQPKTHTSRGHSEYRITALCEECFDEMYPPEKD